MAMSPAAKLSQFNQVIIGARISSSGNASATAGDLEGYSSVVNVSDAEAVTVMVDQAVIRTQGAPRNNDSGEGDGS
jgi:cytochrome c-type biogenesis protein CcmH